MSFRTRQRAVLAALSSGTTLLLVIGSGSFASASASAADSGHRAGGKPSGIPLCPPSAVATGFSDALDKLVYDGVELGGLSDLAWDARSRSWVATVDNHGTDPARLWYFRDLAHPTVWRDPLVLKNADGTEYNGQTSDNEGLAVLPDGDYVVSSETEPSIRIYGRDGVQKQELPVPARFGVTGKTPQGQATNNATLEGLTITPDGRTIVAAMEGALSGDVSASGDATLHRFLVYTADKHGAWKLAKQIAYRADAGMRIAEATAYSDDAFLVEEASFSATAGNAVNLFAVTGLDKAKDVSGIDNLSGAPARDVVKKRRSRIWSGARAWAPRPRRRRPTRCWTTSRAWR